MTTEPQAAQPDRGHLLRVLGVTFGVAVVVGELVDEQQVRHQQGIRQPGRHRQQVEGAALHVVGTDHHQQPARGDDEFAAAAADQLERRCRIGPAQHQPLTGLYYSFSFG